MFYRPCRKSVPSIVVGVFLTTAAASANTYFVGPTGSTVLSQNAAAPGSLVFALAGSGSGVGAAQSGDTVVLEDGTYDGTPNGYTVYNGGVIFQARHWHGAVIKNSTGSNLVGPAGSRATGDVWQGVVLGPSTGLGWSGGGATEWKFLDCVFTQNGGMGAQSHSLFEHDLFTDAYSNAFDIGGDEKNLNTGVTFKNCVVRRSNRLSADSDGVGNKEDFTRKLTYDGLVAYDNNGTTLWFDTDNDDWVIKNSTFFANHGGNNWYFCNIGKGFSTTRFSGSGQDGQGVTVGQSILCISGNAANVGHSSIVKSVVGTRPQIVTISPALPAIPSPSDVFIEQQGTVSSGDGFTTEANDNGTYTDNCAYSNTDHGFYDHASGGTVFGTSGGITVTNNLFAYNLEGFNYDPDQRDGGPGVVENNRFKFQPGVSRAFGSSNVSIGRYPGHAGPLQVVFDYNIYDPDTADGSWAKWCVGKPAAIAGGLTVDAHAKGQDYLQNPETWNQDRHSIQAHVDFRGAPVATYIWPPADDKNWSDIYNPNNSFALKNSVHQVDDTDGAVDNTIDGAIAGHAVGDAITMPVSAHTPIVDGTCEVYDLNGRWVTLTVKPADQAAFLAAVPPYVTCVPGNKTTTYGIRVLLGSAAPYAVSARYSQSAGSAPSAPALAYVLPGSSQAALVWSAVRGADSYDIYRGMSTRSSNGSPIAVGVTANAYTDNGLTNGSTYSYTVEAVNAYGKSAASNQRSATPHHIVGSIAGKSVNAPKPVCDFTALGAIDWRQWGDMGGSNNKAIGAGQISDLTKIGDGKYGWWQPSNVADSWTDGTPSVGNTDDDNFIWCNTASNSGWTFTAPADTTRRTLTILWGGSDGVGGRLSAHLSDGSAPDYVDAKTLVGKKGNARLLETITYNAAKPDATLTISLTKTDAGAGPSVDLMGACLR